jgi:hypothetical protein
MTEKTAPLESISPLAGKQAPRQMLVDIGPLEREYYARQPDMDDPTQRVAFGTSGHRGSPFSGSFTKVHILAITQAICDYRGSQGIDGPSISARTPTRCPRRRSAPRWKSSRPMG